VPHEISELLHYSKFYNRILDSFEFQKYRTHNPKAMAKDKIVNVEVTYRATDFMTSMANFFL
jgi:hypothetical protein